MSKLQKLLFQLCYTPLRALPSAQFINRLRGWVAGRFMKKAGRGLRIYDNVSISNPLNISIGCNVVINPGCFLATSNTSRASLTIGDDSLLAPRCFLETLNHRFDNPDTPINLQGSEAAPIVIGRDCWLGYGVVVLPGRTVGDGSVIGAYGVVTNDIDPYSINVGNPIRQIGQRGVKSKAGHKE